MYMNLRKYTYLIITLLAMAVSGCLTDNIPYPHIQANFTEIAAEGQERAASIDSINRVVTFYLPEDVDIQAVEISSFSLTPDAYLTTDELARPVDLSSPLQVTLHLYYDYVWTLTAVQDITREFSVDGQIGASVIDEPAHRVVATVSDRQDLSKIKVLTCKLGAAGSTLTPDIAGKTVDFTQPVEVTVSQWGRSETWTIYIDTTESLVSTSRVDAWTSVAWVYGNTEASRPYGVEYRLRGDDEWLSAPEAWLSRNGGTFSARLIHLTPNTEYEARAVSGDDAGEAITFTTGMAVQPPNMDFDSWWLDGKIWCPWAQNGTPYWGTGNKGATTLGPSNTTPTEDTPTGRGYAAQLLTKFVGIGAMGKLAAGNIFTGDFVAVDGTNGILSFGRPFTERPTRLKGYMKYKTAPISSVADGFRDLEGRPDTCIIWCALIDQPEPYEIRTRPSNRHLFDSDGPTVVAYGKVEYGYDIDAYIPFEFELDYRSTDRVPKYIIITASASKYGDYFVGGNGATLWLDDFVLEYDY